MWYENHLLPDMSILDNMMLKNYWMASGKSPFINKHQARFKEVQYSQRFDKSAGAKLNTLSGDQQRMMILERCLDSPGKLIAIIEPFIKLNYLSTLQTNRIFRQLLDERKTLLVFSVNYQDLSNICEEIILIGDGYFIDQVPRERMSSINVEALY